MENRIVLDKYVLLEKHTNVAKQVVYCDRKPKIEYARVYGYFCALSLVEETKSCDVSGVIDIYKPYMKTCCDLMYNITRNRIISLEDKREYLDDEVLCVYFADRQKYSMLCRYKDGNIKPVIEYMDDKFIISY